MLIIFIQRSLNEASTASQSILLRSVDFFTDLSNHIKYYEADLSLMVMPCFIFNYLIKNGMDMKFLCEMLLKMILIFNFLKVSSKN